MADTIVQVQDKQGLVTRETFFQMKQDQKDTALALKGLLTDPAKNYKLNSVLHARHLNIIYGVVRGNAYRDIEHSYREGNGPDKFWIAKVCAEYGIDASKFEAEAGIEYGF